MSYIHSALDRSRLWRDCLPPEFLDEDNNVTEPAEQLVGLKLFYQ
jgi:hypothetical protein